MAENSIDWINASFIEKILQNAVKDESIEVSDISIQAATAKGDNYGSSMHRLTVKFSRLQNGQKIQEERSLIAKVEPEGDIQQELILPIVNGIASYDYLHEKTQSGGKIRKSKFRHILAALEKVPCNFYKVAGIGAFEKEISMMAETLPWMNKNLATLGFSTLSAQYFDSQLKKPTYIIIEDLAPKGFRLANRQAGLDLDHALMAIRNLGKFHGASIALIEKNPKGFVNYKIGLLHKDQHPMVDKFFTGNLRTVAHEAVTWSEFSPRISEKLLKLSEVVFEKMCEAALCQEGEFNVLNHGDFWVNNMMFRYDEQNKPVNHIFVDFQTCNYGPPAVDLLYFIGTSLDDDVRLHHRELLLREYYASLTDTMVKLKCDTEAPSFENLQASLKKRFILEVNATVSLLPLTLLDKKEELDFAEMVKSDSEYRNPAYRGKTYKIVMNRLLPLYDSQGLLDV